MPTDIDEFDQDELEEILGSKMVQKFLSYRKLTDGISSIKEDDVMYDQLISGIQSRLGRDLADKTVENVLNALVNEVESNTSALEPAEEEDDFYD